MSDGNKDEYLDGDGCDNAGEGDVDGTERQVDGSNRLGSRGRLQ